VEVTTRNFLDNGQFSVNGQCAEANYFMVDGVSANIGLGLNSTYGGDGVAGALPAFSVLGGTNSLVSVDAMEEFRIQTSTYAPEFGRKPGAHISIATRSSTTTFTELHSTISEMTFLTRTIGSRFHVNHANHGISDDGAGGIDDGTSNARLSAWACAGEGRPGMMETRAASTALKIVANESYATPG